MDLCDYVKHFVVQVTGTSDRKKIEYTIAQFARERENYASYALKILIIGKKSKYRKPFAGQEKIEFKPQEDLWDVPYILNEMRSLSTNALHRVDEFLKRELQGVQPIPDDLRKDRLRMYERFKAFFTDLARAGLSEKSNLITEFKNQTDGVSFLGMPEVDVLRKEIISRARILQRVEDQLNGRESRLPPEKYHRWTDQEAELINWFDGKSKELKNIFLPYCSV